jgi:hypothetical protein
MSMGVLNVTVIGLRTCTVNDLLSDFVSFRGDDALELGFLLNGFDSGHVFGLLEIS